MLYVYFFLILNFTLPTHILSYRIAIHDDSAKCTSREYGAFTVYHKTRMR